VQSTDAALTINENADPTVRSDMEGALQRIASAVAHRPNGEAAALTSLVGVSLDLPIHGGKLAMGTWQVRVCVRISVCVGAISGPPHAIEFTHRGNRVQALMRRRARLPLSPHHRGYTSRTSPAPPPPPGASWWSPSRCGAPRRPLGACGDGSVPTHVHHPTSWRRVCGRRRRRR